MLGKNAKCSLEEYHKNKYKIYCPNKGMTILDVLKY